MYRELVGGPCLGEGGGRSEGSEHTAVVFAIVADHKHDFPFKDIVVVYKTARDSGYVLVRLHLLELSSQQRRGGERTRGGAGHGAILSPRSAPSRERKEKKFTLYVWEGLETLYTLDQVLV